MTPIKITIKVSLTAGIKFDKEAGVYVAYTPALGIFSQGESIDRAKLALEDAVHSFLLVAHKNNLLEKCLKTTAFKPSTQPKKGLERKGKEYISITEEQILEQSDYGCIFKIPAELPYPLATAAA